MYRMLARGQGADVESLRLCDVKSLSGYDAVLTDLDGYSVRDNQHFIDLINACEHKPIIRMFSGAFVGDAEDLPMRMDRSGVVQTHCDTAAVKVITDVVELVRKRAEFNHQGEGFGR